MIIDKIITIIGKSALFALFVKLVLLLGLESGFDVSREGGEVTERKDATIRTEIPISDSILMDLFVELKKADLFLL